MPEDPVHFQQEEEGHEIQLVRNFAPETDRQGEIPSNVRRMNQQSDAVLRVIATLDDALSMEMVNDINWVVNFQHQPVRIAQDIFFHIVEIQRSNKPDRPISLIRMKLSSPVLTAKDLVAYVTRLYRDYSTSQAHDLIGQQFYFDQKYRNNERLDVRGNPHDGNDPRLAKKYELNMAPKHLSFVKYPFRSNKSFTNLFGEEMDRIERRIRRFIDNKAWYDAKGIPYQLGICLSGDPGTGKTSCIGAIANMTGRHVINVNAKDIVTHTQLKRLFHEEDLHVYDDEDLGNTNRLSIPVSRRIFVIDEIDTMGAILHDRDTGNLGFDEGDPLYDEITLGHWLSLLDGTNQADGRIIIITTNYPERLSKALLRPGRIDLNVKLGKASRNTIKRMYEHFFEEEFPSDRFHSLPDKILTPAEVSNIMQQCIDDPMDFWSELREEVQRRQVPGSGPSITKTGPLRPILKTQEKVMNPFVGVNTINNVGMPTNGNGGGKNDFSISASNTFGGLFSS